MKISKASLDEVDSLLQLQKKVWNEKELFGPYSIAIFIRYGLVLVAKEKNKIVGGLISINVCDNQYVYVVDLFIDPNQQRKGIAKKLYQKLFTMIDKPIITNIENDLVESIALHKSLGFKRGKCIKRFYKFTEELPSYMYVRKTQ